MNEFGGLSEQVFIIGIALGIALLIFLLLREFWCWYWKINKLVSLQKDTNELLEELLSSSLIETKKELALSVENHRGDEQDQAEDFDKYEF